MPEPTDSGHVLQAMVKPQDEASGNALGQQAVVFPDALVNRPRLQSVPRDGGGMYADHLTDKVTPGHEYGG